MDFCQCEHSTASENGFLCLNCGLLIKETLAKQAKPISHAVASEITRPPEPINHDLIGPLCLDSDR